MTPEPAPTAAAAPGGHGRDGRGPGFCSHVPIAPPTGEPADFDVPVAVPLTDTAGQLAPLRARLDARVAAVLDRGTFVRGPEAEAFERELAAHLGVRHVVAVASGADALAVALRALGAGPGDEVVVPAFAPVAAAMAIPPTGAAPVFCDVDLDTGTVTAATVRAALTPRTRAVVAVDLFGNPAPIPALEALGVPVVEDAAQAAGARLDGRAAGALGTVGALSLAPPANLPACGDGGAIATDDDALADRARTLRALGSRDGLASERVGWSSRLGELEAATARVALEELERWSDGRRAAAAHYAAAGLGELVTLPAATPGAAPAWHLHVIRHALADALQYALAAAGVGARGCCRTPLHRQPAFAPWADGVALPVADELARTHLALPMSPQLDRAAADLVVAAVRAALHP